MPAHTDQDEASILVRRALDQHESNLIAYAASILGGDYERGRDVVQDSLLKLYLTDPARVRENLKSWLFTVCRNRALDILRKDHRLELGDDEALETSLSNEPDPGEAAVNRELYEHVWRCVDRLRPKQREVIRLKFLHDCSYQEIATITGLTATNVGFIIHNAIRKLREFLAQEHADRPQPH